jgi:Amidases related to nicotinamidase
MSRLDRNKAVLVVIDVQEKLVRVIHEHDEVEKNIERLIRGSRVLGVPVLVTEQYRKGLGATTELLARAFEETGGFDPIEKMCFSSWGCAAFAEKLKASGRREVILCGIEAHVCVYQTALDLLRGGFEVTLVADAVSSRTPRNRRIAIERMMLEGAKLSTTEMALFEMTVESGTEEFKSISKIVK